MLLLTGDEADDPFRECRHAAFHLEVRDSYTTPTESEAFRRFLDGDPDPDDYSDRPWTRFMRETTSRGVHVSRVRVVTVPHTDYHRWLLSITGSNVDAGEDIRYLPRHLAGDIPPDDWWLFDDTRVGFNLVTPDGRPAGLAITSDPHIAAYCRGIRDRLWSSATPYRDYLGH
ncbi:DUF6879 family protein [Nocardia farcinica]|uniref:DUF6879 domain-containing protein n=1 Tax=Nocardia farcinica (strain IFM 10152) TaxID=247156 RepID=Q5YSU9_NOCFA|nr:DUF6879 family protein [Nocardia farcinica]BAD58742.1 hypothetical protein NFA_38940 [Nocardia farcinica IFM 10152]